MGRLGQRLNGLYSYRNLLQQLVERDVKLKYRRSFFGVFVEYFKSLNDHDDYGNLFFPICSALIFRIIRFILIIGQICI